MKRRPNGFTLIELLVVISIIALLIGILLPALGVARDAGRAAQCLANLRGFGQLTQIYLSDNKLTFPERPGGGGSGQVPYNAIGATRTILKSDQRSANALACPSDEWVGRLFDAGQFARVATPTSLADPLLANNLNAVAANFIGSDATQLERVGLGEIYGLANTDKIRISYGQNTHTSIVSGSDAVSKRLFSLRFEDYQQTSTTLLAADSAWINPRGYADANATYARTAAADLGLQARVWNSGISNNLRNGTASPTGTPPNSGWSGLTVGAGGVTDPATNPAFAFTRQSARHPGGTNNIAFFDGSGKGLTQRATFDTVIYTPGERAAAQQY